MREVVVFAKEPVPGCVKTRLAAEIGTDAAVRLYDSFLSDLAGELRSPDEWRAVLAHAEEEPGERLRALFEGWEMRPQGAGDLGERLARSGRSSLEEGADETVVVGSDAPTLTRGDVRRAFLELCRADVVLAPSPDGGYALVGWTRGVDPRALFEGVRWSSAFALADTRHSASRAGFTTSLLPEVPDVDVAADIAALKRALPSRDGATAKALAELFGR